MPRYRVVLQRFPYGSVEHTPVVNWMLGWAAEVSADKRFELIIPPPLDDTPITMTRNRSVEIARKLDADFLVMIDSDMHPDCELGEDPLAKPFWPTTIDFMLKHQGPCVVGAPYCGPPPHENIYVFNWQNLETNKPEDDVKGLKIGQFSREHAAVLGGIQEVAALPTGLIVFDMRGFDKIKPPYFTYEYENEGARCVACNTPAPGKQTHKASTEDVVTTRDLSLGGVPQYCNWDAWAGHRKIKTVRKPRPFTADGVAAKMHEAIVNRRVGGEQLLEIDGSRFAKEIAEAEARDGVIPHDFKAHRTYATDADRISTVDEYIAEEKARQGRAYPLNAVVGTTASPVPAGAETLDEALDRLAKEKMAKVSDDIAASGLTPNAYADLFNGPVPFGDPAFVLPPVTFGDLLMPMDGMVPPGTLDPNSLPAKFKDLTPLG